MENNNQENLVEINYQPYIKKNYFFSIAELKFYNVLKEVIDNNYFIFPKVRISDLIQSKYGKDKYSYFNKIKSKHVDFVICEKDPIKTKAVIELDDSSHNAPSRKERDKFVDEAFANAGIPIVHIKVKSEYDKEKLIEQIKKAYNTKYTIRPRETKDNINPQLKIYFTYLLYLIVAMAILSIFLFIIK